MMTEEQITVSWQQQTIVILDTNLQRYDLTQTSKIELYFFNERAFTFWLQLCVPPSPFLPQINCSAAIVITESVF